MPLFFIIAVYSLQYHDQNFYCYFNFIIFFLCVHSAQTDTCQEKNGIKCQKSQATFSPIFHVELFIHTFTTHNLPHPLPWAETNSTQACGTFKVPRHQAVHMHSKNVQHSFHLCKPDSLKHNAVPFYVHTNISWTEDMGQQKEIYTEDF